MEADGRSGTLSTAVSRPTVTGAPSTPIGACAGVPANSAMTSMAPPPSASDSRITAPMTVIAARITPAPTSTTTPTRSAPERAPGVADEDISHLHIDERY